MFDSFFSTPSRARQPSIITGSSGDTMSTTTAPPAIVSKRINIRNKAKNRDDVGCGAETNSHHSHSSADDESLVSVRSGFSKCCKQGTVGLRRWQLFQMIFLPFIPITALIVQNSTLLSSVVVNLQEAWEMKQQVRNLLCIVTL